LIEFRRHYRKYKQNHDIHFFFGIFNFSLWYPFEIKETQSLHLPLTKQMSILESIQGQPLFKDSKVERMLKEAHTLD
jgi:hypothetical protein